jgi:hypothetical protein
MSTVIQREDDMRVRLEMYIWIEQPEVTRHAEVNYEQHFVLEVDEDVFAAPAHIGNPHPGHRVNELFRLRMPDDAREVELATHDGAARKVRPQVGDYRFYFG